MRVLFVLLAVAFLVSPAAAQQWTDPEGHFILEYGSAWQLVPPQALSDNPQVLAIFASVDPPAILQCPSPSVCGTGGTRSSGGEQVDTIFHVAPAPSGEDRILVWDARADDC